MEELHKSGHTDFPSSKVLGWVTGNWRLPVIFMPILRRSKRASCIIGLRIITHESLLPSKWTDAENGGKVNHCTDHWPESSCCWHFSGAPESSSLQNTKNPSLCFWPGYEQHVSLVPGPLILLQFVIMLFDLELELWNQSKPFKQPETSNASTEMCTLHLFPMRKYVWLLSSY